MRKSKGRADDPIITGQDQWGYAEVMAHLGISRRTLIRFIVAGCVPQPAIIKTKGWWRGAALVAIRGGLQIPGTFDYIPNAREQKRTRAIKFKANLQAKVKRMIAGRRAAAKRRKVVTP